MRKKLKFKPDIFLGLSYRQSNNINQVVILCEYVDPFDLINNVSLHMTESPLRFVSSARGFSLSDLILALKTARTVMPSEEIDRYIKTLKFLRRRGFKIHFGSMNEKEVDTEEIYTSFTFYRERPPIRFHKGRSYAIYKFKNKLPLGILFSDTSPITKA